MVSNVEIWFNQVFFYCLQKLDSVLNIFGYKLFAVNTNNILSGLTVQEKKEASLPYNANLIRDLEIGFQKDSRVPVKDRLILCEQVKEWLRSCVNVKRALTEYPGAAQTPVIKPIIIVGPPRTGTTFLHRLMAQDPRLFAPMLWELKCPTPPGRPANWRQCTRYLTYKKTCDINRALMTHGNLEKIHPLRADNPDECSEALGCVEQQQWCITRMETMEHLAEHYYNRTHEDMVDMYKHYKSHLQVIAYKGMAGKRFLLKAPYHLSQLDALLEVFPDACLVFTHRSVSACVASRASLIHSLTHDWGVPDKNYGQKMVKMTSYLTNRGVATMKKFENKDKKDNPFYNIDFKVLMKNPMDAVRCIYEKSGLELTQDIEGMLHTWLADNPQHKHGRHEYSLADYGVSERDIQDSFKPYIERMSKYGMAVL